MKHLLVLALSLVSTVAVAADQCFVGTNPEWATVQLLNEDLNGVEKSERATLVTAEITEADPNDANSIATLKITAVTPSMNFTATAGRFDQREPDTYGVECDGGQIKLHVSRIGYTAVTERLAGEVLNPSGECHGYAEISFPQLVLQRVECAK